MKALTKKEILKIVKERPDDAFYCPDCFYILEEIESDEGKKLTCHSQVCENSEAYYTLEGEEVAE